MYRVGLTVPHIAAGANLNLPLVGGILRRGGAFFLRRSIRGDELYAEVFAAYVHEVLRRGFPMEYFVEGGRSRTGRMPTEGWPDLDDGAELPARTLAAAAVCAGLHRLRKLMEGGSYTQELAGAAKRKGIGVGPARRDTRSSP